MYIYVYIYIYMCVYIYMYVYIYIHLLYSIVLNLDLLRLGKHSQNNLKY